MATIADRVRNPICVDCKLSNGAQNVCIVGRGPKRAEVMIVGKLPDSPNYRQDLSDHLAAASIDIDSCFTSSAIKCKNWDLEASNADVKACRKYLDHEILLVKPRWILALGNEALLALTGRSGITKYRGQVFDRPDGARVVPTISPSAVKRNPGQLAGFHADLSFFSAQVEGREHGVPDPEYHQVSTKDDLRELLALLQTTTEVAYDVETVGDGEWAEDARIVSLSLTMEIDGQVVNRFLPLFHPESPWRRVWERILLPIVRRLRKVKKRVAHNGKYDDKWLWKFSGLEIHQTFDTLVAAHLLDENRPKGLKPLAQSLLGVRPWAINTKNLLETPLAEILEYNTKDTYYTYYLKKIFAKQLKKRPRQLRLFTAIMMPATSVYTESEMAGIWVDREVLATNTKIAYDTLHAIEEELMDWVPGNAKANDPPMSPEQLVELGWPQMGKRAKLAEVNFNASNWARWWLFEYLDLPVIERGKEKPDGSPGAPSMREGVLAELKGEHPAVEVMMRRVEWQKITSSFLTPYMDLLDDDDRIHTVFKPTGTVTGRTSSGKEDEEKITASRGKRRGVNLQQVPRNKIVRGVFGAPPPNYFVEFDFSQIELRLAAFIARERHMLQLYRAGADIHRTTAASVLGKPLSQVTTEERKKVGKGNNFGFLYGMGWRKFITTALENYGLAVDDLQAQGFRHAFFDLFPDLPEWHARQRRLVRKYGRVESPLGRIRHLPDINSPDQGVRAEAERQAINSPVQGMASDMCLLSMILVEKRAKRLGIPMTILGTVHDAINFEITPAAMSDALPLIRDVMENLPLERLFNVELDVPILADCKVGSHWGGATELTSDQVTNWSPSLVGSD